ncbi:MAG: DUF3606 domain-containing protein [Pirellulales bacterium]
MADDKSKRGPADRTRINIHEPYEVEYWSRHFGVSPDRLRQLVKDHGVIVADIEKALKDALN